MERQYFESSAGTLSYKRRRGERSLLLVHGFTASADIWDGVVGYLDKTFDVICVDLFGHGKSRTPVIKSTDLGLNNLMEVQTESILELLHHLGIRKYYVAGSSYGGLIAVSLALSPLEPERMVMIDSAGMTPKTDKEFINNFKALLDRNSGKSFTFPKDEVFKVVSNDGTFIARKILESIKIPTLVIWGEDDHIFDKKWGKLLSNALQVSEFRIVEGGDHTPFTTHPKEVAEMINDFFLRNEKRSSIL